MKLKRIDFIKRFTDGSTYRLGTAIEYSDRTWKFMPNISGRAKSSRYHPTWERCLPRWIGYPDHCESTVREVEVADA